MRYIFAQHVNRALLVLAGLVSVYWLFTGEYLPAIIAIAQVFFALLSERRKHRGLLVFTIAAAILALSVLWALTETRAEQVIAVLFGASTMLSLGITWKTTQSASLEIDSAFLDALAKRVKKTWIEDRLNAEIQAGGFIRVLAVDQVSTTHKETNIYPTRTSSPTSSNVDEETRMVGSLKEVLSKSGDAVRIIHESFGKRQRLLVTGAHGSGKTIALLRVIDELLEARSLDNPAIPILFNLSSWSKSRKPLVNWMIDELDRDYGIGKPKAQAIVAGPHIIPILDGLDEVSQDARRHCIEAINDYAKADDITNGLQPSRRFLVCCSEEILQNVESFVFLFSLSRALDSSSNEETINRNVVRLLPLDDIVINKYLKHKEVNIDEVHALRRDIPVLDELIKSPFMLKIIAELSFNPDFMRSLKDKGVDEAKSQLLDVYVDKLFELSKKKDGPSGDYPDNVTRRYLSTIARHLVMSEQSHFFIAHIQPELLGPSRWLTTLYTILSFLPAALVGGIIGGIGSGTFLYYLSVEYPVNLYGALIGIVAIALAAGLFGGTSIGIMSFLTCVITTAFMHHLDPDNGIRIGAIATGIVGGLTTSINKQLGFFVPNNISFGRTTLRFVLGVVGGLAIALSAIWMFELLMRYAISIVSLFLLNFLFGVGIGRLIRIIAVKLLGKLRLARVTTNEGEIIPRERLRWSVSGSLANFALILGAGLLATLIISSFELKFVVLLALTLSMLAGFQSEGEEPDRRPRLEPNYAILVSGKSAMKVMGAGVIMGGVAGLLFNDGQATILYTLALMSAAFIVYGGFAVFQHYVLRFVLKMSGILPYRLEDFFDYTSTLSFTRRAGARYMFTHAFLRDYFAKKGF